MGLIILIRMTWRLYPGRARARSVGRKAEPQGASRQIFCRGTEGRHLERLRCRITKGDATSQSALFRLTSMQRSTTPGNSLATRCIFSANSEDMLLRAKLEQQLASKDVRICNLSQELAAAKIELTKSIAAFLGASRLVSWCYPFVQTSARQIADRRKKAAGDKHRPAASCVRGAKLTRERGERASA